METLPKEKSMRDQVLTTIHNRRVTMRPRWHFILTAALYATGAIIVLLTLLYLSSFTLFAMRQTGVMFIPIFGFHGWYAFIISLPWLLIILTLVFLTILEMLVRHYAFAYRRPLVYSIVGMVIVVIVGATIVETTPFHHRLFIEAEHGRLPFAGDFYRGFGEQHFRDIHRGVITEMTDHTLLIQDRNGEVMHIIITPRTRLPLGMDFARGDVVVVFGPGDDVIQAFGIRKIDKDPE